MVEQTKKKSTGLLPGMTYSVGDTSNNPTVKSSGTAGPSAAAQAAAAGLAEGDASAVKSMLPSGQLINVDEKGTPIAYYPAGYAESQFAKLAKANNTAEIASLQSERQKVGAYNKYPGYKPVLGVYSPTDVAALNEVATIGEQLKNPVINNVFTEISKNPKLSSLVSAGGTTAKTLTSKAEAASVLTDQYLNVFNEKPTSAEITAYTNAINAKEKASKTALSAQERQDVLLSVMNQKAASLGKTGKVEQGSLGRYVRDIRNTYADNGVPIDEQTILKQATQALRGQDAYNNVISTIQLNAKTMFPALKDYIDQGKTVKEMLNPYINLRANILEVDPSQIKVSDLADVAQGTNLMTTNDYKQKLYQDPAWKKTQNYMNTSMNDARTLLANFGLGA